MFGKQVKELWICGKNTATKRCPHSWEFCGVFDSEGKAVEAALTPDHFVAPATLNEAQPDETREWPGCYYPHGDSQ